MSGQFLEQRSSDEVSYLFLKGIGILNSLWRRVSPKIVCLRGLESDSIFRIKIIEPFQQFREKGSLSVLFVKSY